MVVEAGVLLPSVPCACGSDCGFVKAIPTHLINRDAYASRLAYKINECAAMIGVSHQTIRRAIARGDIRVSRKTRHVLVPRTELERFIAA